MFISEYNADNWNEVELSIESSGKAPMKHGPDVFRFYPSIILSVLLPNRGWELKKKHGDYVYLKPPAGSVEPYTIKIKIPSKEQALEIANTLYADGKSIRGQIGEWPYLYLHKHEQVTMEYGTKDGHGYEKRHVDLPRSSLEIGQSGLWYVLLTETT